MSFQRSYKAPYPTERGPNGRFFCRGSCGREVPKGKLYWCGVPECLAAYRVKNDPGFARDQVWERDKGICAKCGRDSKRIGRIIRYLRQRLKRKPFLSAWYAIFTHGRRAKYHAWRSSSPFRTHDWEMDHIIPVVEGGGGCGLEGLRTLCLACHQGETAALAARRAAKRRGDQLVLPILPSTESSKECST
jgi:5-methylcytosine-specific restriction endonuclease McrA